MLQKSLRGLTPTTFWLTPEALTATLLLKMNRGVLDVAQMCPSRKQDLVVWYLHVRIYLHILLYYIILYYIILYYIILYYIILYYIILYYIILYYIILYYIILYYIILYYIILYYYYIILYYIILCYIILYYIIIYIYIYISSKPQQKKKSNLPLLQ